MKRIFRAKDDQELADNWQAIVNGECLEDPKDGILWDAADARYNRHVQLQDGTYTADYQTERVTLSHWTVKAAAVLCLVLFILFTIAGLTSAKVHGKQETLVLDGVAYECYFVDDVMESCVEE